MVFKSLDLLLPLFMFWRSNEVVGRSGGTRRAMRVSGHPAGGLRQVAALWARERKGRLGRRRGRCGASGVNHRGGSGGVWPRPTSEGTVRREPAPSGRSGRIIRPVSIHISYRACRAGLISSEARSKARKMGPLIQLQ